MDFKFCIRSGLLQIFTQCLGLIPPDLIRFVLLPVQVRQIHTVKIDERQSADARPGNGNGNVGTKPAKAADRNRSR